MSAEYRVFSGHQGMCRRSAKKLFSLFSRLFPLQLGGRWGRLTALHPQRRDDLLKSLIEGRALLPIDETLHLPLFADVADNPLGSGFLEQVIVERQRDQQRGMIIFLFGD